MYRYLVRWTVWVFVAGFLVAAPRFAAAQITTATVAGTVRDTQDAAVPGATVTLTSATRGTTLGETVTNASGDFLFPNVPADTYTVQVTLEGFKTLNHPGIEVSPGDRVVVPTLTIEVGELGETVEVKAETPSIQAQSGERSFTIATTEVENLPIAGRNYATLTRLTPGVMTSTWPGQQASRLGGGGQNNITMDGVSVLDTGANAQMLYLNPDAIAEVKVLTAGYQAEYGRSSGLQIISVTKSGTNTFRGSTYYVKRDSAWNTNSWENQENGDPKSVSEQTDWGYTIGGPVGRPGGDNKLFFFYGHELRPRTTGNITRRFRVPTELERQGDFSQTLDNQGRLFNLIRDHTTGLPCEASNTSGCFQDEGMLGRIPQDRLYGSGRIS
ncbi:MAG: TonB-dependent receptor plug domain-containing protein [Luteitalea sp.]|nr:TonB-dependent receptor plug domain-containing protein [Luteitalea sp.]